MRKISAHILSASILSTVFLTSCTSLAGKNRSDTNSVFAKGSNKYEVVSISEQLSEQLSKYPTRFEVPATDAKTSLERTFFFYKTYTSNFSPKSAQATDRNLNFTNEGGSDVVFYRVSRVLTKSGVRYTVSAASRDKSQNPSILASNLARFIKEGSLEVSLIKP